MRIETNLILHRVGGDTDTHTYLSQYRETVSGLNSLAAPEDKVQMRYKPSNGKARDSEDERQGSPDVEQSVSAYTIVARTQWPSTVRGQKTSAYYTVFGHYRDMSK